MSFATNNNALVHAFLFTGDGYGKPVSWPEIQDWTPADGILWVHLNYEHPEAQQWITDNSQLDPLTQQSLLADETRPRCVHMEDGLLVNLRGVNSNPGSEPEDMVSVRLFTDGNRVITTRKRRLLSIQDIAEGLLKGHGPRNVGEFLETLAGRLTERMSDVISLLDESIDAIEEEMINQASQAYRSKLAELRREVIMLRRYLAPQREALNRLQSESADWLGDEHKLGLRESSDRLARYIEDLDSARDRAAVAFEELSSQLAEQLNSRMYILSVIAAIFLPLGFLTGLFGINVGGIPFAETPFGFLAISLILVLIVFVQIVIFRSRKWF